MSFFSPASTGAAAAGDVLNTIADAIGKMKEAAKHGRTSSLVDVTAVARVEPLVIIDSDSFNAEQYIGPVIQCAHTIFTAYYLQAVALMGTVGNIKIAKTLDKLNPNRKPDRSGFITHMLMGQGMESAEGTVNFAAEEPFGLSMESFKLPTYGMEAKDAQEEELRSDAKVSDKALATAAEQSNLSVGKLVNVTLTDQGQTVTIPLQIRLIANEMPATPMLKLLSMQGLDRTWTERYWKWRAGRIGFIKDLILMQDLVRADKRAMMEDETGLIDEIMRRAKNNKLAGFFSKNASMNEAANILIFSEETARQLKQQHNIDIDNAKQRQTVFDGSYAMIMVKIDREYERVTFYINGMPLGSSMNRTELKSNAGKNSSTDLVEVFQALKKSDSSSLF
jgi:hypothetical protein